MEEEENTGGVPEVIPAAVSTGEIEISEVRNAASQSSNNLRMDVEINHPEHGWIPYTLDPSDTDTTINNDKVMALIGTDFAAYVAPTQAELDAEQALVVRDQRNNLLVTEVDPIVTNPLRWADLSSEKQTEWAQYRTALLAIPEQSGFPHDITWPEQPT
jgi:hypothetical protein